MRRSCFLALVVVSTLLSGRPLWAQDQPPGEAAHHRGLHFAHPLIAESVSPDTKTRFNYDFSDLADGTTENGFEFEFEHAFHRAFSIEGGIPLVILDVEGESHVSTFGNAELAFKFANFAFEEQGLLLGYGIEFGLPSGDDERGIGSDHILEVEPFLNMGYLWRTFEWVSFVTFGIPTNQDADEEVETELGYNFSSLYHVNPRLQLLLELDGQSVLSGEEAGTAVWNLTPGFKFAPRAGSSLFLGAGVRLPLSGEQEFDAQALVSLFYHF